MKTYQFSASRIVSTILFTTCIVLFSSMAFAGTYYISPTGNDVTGTGSISNPWKTLRKATSTITTPGNIIHVNAGTYIETSTCILAPGVSIEGDGVTSVIKASFSTMYEMIIQAISPEGTNGNQHISNIKMDGQNSTSWAIQIQGRSNFEIHDCTIVDFAQRGIVWGGRSDNSDNPPMIYATGNKFYNNTVTNCASFDGTYGYGCLNIGGQQGMLIYNNNITTTGTTPGWPIKLWNDGYVKGCKIYDNVLKRPPFPYEVNGTDNYFDFCIELFHEQGLEIYNNTIEGSIDLNYQTKGSYDYSAYIHDNIIGRSTQAAHWESGVILEFSTENCIIENNTFKSISHPIFFSLRPGNYMNNITIQKNLAYNIGKTDGTRQGKAINIQVNDDGTNYTASNFVVYNNTFLALTGANSPYFGADIPGGNGATNVQYINNILCNFNYYVMRSDYGSHINGLQIKNNALYNNGSNNNFEFANGNPTNYTNSNNIFTNPKLDATYSPIPGSPVIETGVNVGLPYNGSAPNRGFKETGGTLPVNLLYFTAKEDKGINILSWKTATEINSAYFTIEKSNDGNNYTPIGIVNAAGNSSTEISYSFTDNKPSIGKNYYRLVMVDKDASFAYSNIVMLNNKFSGSLGFSYINISRSGSNSTIIINSAKAQPANLAVIDASGRVVYNTSISLLPGTNNIIKTLPSIASGLYYVKVATPEESIIKNTISQ
ncbi:MAG: T9SS type A sorting domain-containing protein [Ferruginibacter sp.]|nr:T9SS type A sorting domain-containing protein [Bacteroidota bacterium]MBX2919768.1 T9SS type A sorting domain-containing protein [Ferruginibacter sp.]MCC7379814.1 T9SS type A sorting domain-containing protein [Chitinophagaceae bacterium]